MNIMKKTQKKSSLIIFCALSLLFSSFTIFAEEVTLPSLSTSTMPSSSTELPAAQSTGTAVDTQQNQQQMQQFGAMGMANYFPIQTPELSAGDVTASAQRNDALLQPIFLIGSDDRSKTWLEQNRDPLKQMHAIGILVQVNSPDEYSAIQTIGEGITIIPASPQNLIARYGLQHYPVLITKEGIAQ